MGKHPKMRWKDASMKGKLQKILAARLTGSCQQEETLDSESFQSDEERSCFETLF
jgi:hypothetical protein